MDNKIIEKIKKLMALSKSSNENEAELAMMRAQELLVKHHLTMNDIKDKDTKTNKLNILEIDLIIGKRITGWKIALANVLAKNFRCETFVATMLSGGKKLRVVGGEEDAKVVEILFTYAIGFIDSRSRSIRRLLRKQSETARGSTQSYITGFLEGLATHFENQINDNIEWGLILVTPVEIDDYINKKYNYCKSKPISINLSSGNNPDAFQKGFDDGKDFNNNKKLN